jgi:putative transposase
MRWCILEPRRFRTVAPLGEQLAQAGVAELLFTLLVAFLLQRECLVEHEPARPGEAAHIALLVAVRHQFVFEGLETLHGDSIFWSMSNDNDIRHGRHCVFLMHVHLVFVTKYRREVFTKNILDDLRGIFASVCADFEAELVEFDGEDDHVHLLVNHPPKVAVSALVNSLKGVSSRMIRKKNYPSIRKKLWGGALWSPSYFAGSCGGAPIEIIRQYIEQQQTPH